MKNTILKVIGILLMVFGVADLVLCNAGVVDLTGVSWSPWVAMLAGGAIHKLGSSGSEAEEA